MLSQLDGLEAVGSFPVGRRSGDADFAADYL